MYRIERLPTATQLSQKFYTPTIVHESEGDTFADWIRDLEEKRGFWRGGVWVPDRDLDLTCCNFSCRDFGNLHSVFSSVDVSGSSFKGAKGLGNSVWEFGNLENCDFSETDLRGARFDLVRLKGVNFSDSDLSDSWFRDCDLTDVSWWNTNLENSGGRYNNLIGGQWFERAKHLDSVEWWKGFVLRGIWAHEVTFVVGFGVEPQIQIYPFKGTTSELRDLIDSDDWPDWGSSTEKLVISKGYREEAAEVLRKVADLADAHIARLPHVQSGRRVRGLPKDRRADEWAARRRSMLPGGLPVEEVTYKYPEVDE